MFNVRGCLDVLGGADRVAWVADLVRGACRSRTGPTPRSTKIFYHSAMMQKHYAKMAATLEEVQRNFEGYGLLSERVRFLKGWFKDTLPSAPIDRLSVMRLDGDYYASTMDALTALYDKLSLGGFVIIDDYGEDLWTDCRQAVDEFRRARAIANPLTMVDSRCGFWQRKLH